MENVIHLIWVIPVIVFCFAWWRITLLNKGWFQGYKQGQIDAMNGKAMYEKKTNSDGETSWQKIKSKWNKA